MSPRNRANRQYYVRVRQINDTNYDKYNIKLQRI